MPIQLTTGDTFDGIDVVIKQGQALVSNSLVTAAAALIKKADGSTEERSMTVGPEDARFRYRLVSGDYASFPGGKSYQYRVRLTFTDRTVKYVPSVGFMTMTVRNVF